MDNIFDLLDRLDSVKERDAQLSERESELDKRRVRLQQYLSHEREELDVGSSIVADARRSLTEEDEELHRQLVRVGGEQWQLWIEVRKQYRPASRAQQPPEVARPLQTPVNVANSSAALRSDRTYEESTPLLSHQRTLPAESSNSEPGRRRPRIVDWLSDKFVSRNISSVPDNDLPSPPYAPEPPSGLQLQSSPARLQSPSPAPFQSSVPAPPLSRLQSPSPASADLVPASDPSGIQIGSHLPEHSNIIRVSDSAWIRTCCFECGVNATHDWVFFRGLTGLSNHSCIHHGQTHGPDLALAELCRIEYLSHTEVEQFVVSNGKQDFFSEPPLEQVPAEQREPRPRFQLPQQLGEIACIVRTNDLGMGRIAL